MTASLLLVRSCLFAEVVSLTPVADTTLAQVAPDNNLGGACFFNAGTSGIRTLNRGLFRFDFLEQIPQEAVIQSVNLTLQVTGQPDTGARASLFGIYRVFTDWGEGTKGVATCPPESFQSPGFGEPADLGEATWRERFALGSSTWSAPGGVAGVDYAALESAVTFVGAAGDPVVFEASSQLVSDVQTWVSNPSANFGWMLISLSEDVPKTARRFGSREDLGNEPLLVIEYQVVPEPGFWAYAGCGVMLFLGWRRWFSGPRSLPR